MPKNKLTATLSCFLKEEKAEVGSSRTTNNKREIPRLGIFQTFSSAPKETPSGSAPEKK